MILQNQTNNKQLCENEEILDESFDRSKKQNIDNQEKETKENLLKKESKTPIEFFDIYP